MILKAGKIVIPHVWHKQALALTHTGHSFLLYSIFSATLLGIGDKMPICKFSRGRICVAKNNGEQRENKRSRGTWVSAEISGAARNLTGSPQPIWEMGAVSNLVLWVGPVL